MVDGNTVKVYRERSRSMEPSEVYKAEALPENRDDTAKEIFHHLETGEPLATMLDKETNLRAMMILDSGYRSSISGKLEAADSCKFSVENL